MPGSSLPTSVAVSRICSRDPAERRNERGRTLEAPAPGVVVNLTKPAPGRTGGQTARNPLGSTPSRNLDGLPNASFPPSDATNGMEPDDARYVGACSNVLREEHEIVG